MDGLSYREFEYHDSRVHFLSIDLTKRSIRPVMGAEAFPILRVYPLFDAITQGALASVGGGFNTVWYHGLGYADQPLHALVVDREIWTDGVGAGGFGVLLGDAHIETRQNRIQVVIWRPDHTTIEVNAINRGHDERVVAFTARGGTNQRAREGKHYVRIGEPSWWSPSQHGQAQTRTMKVQQVSMFEPLVAEGDSVVLEARWPMKLHEGDEVTWVQHLGGKDVRHVISGWPEIIHDGVNLVPAMDLHGVASNGPDNWFIRKNPRMVIGASKNGRTAYFITVQGRIPESKGLRLKELATLLLREGVYSAANFDGGGSAYMWLKDGGLVADSTYGDGTLQGLRPDHYATAVF